LLLAEGHYVTNTAIFCQHAEFVWLFYACQCTFITGLKPRQIVRVNILSKGMPNHFFCGVLSKPLDGRADVSNASLSINSKDGLIDADAGDEQAIFFLGLP